MEVNMFRIGDSVELFGLSSVTGVALNGQRGEVVQLPTERSGTEQEHRFGVRLANREAPIAVRQRNIRLNKEVVYNKYVLPFRVRFGKGRSSGSVFKWKCDFGNNRNKTTTINIKEILQHIDCHHDSGDIAGSSAHHILYFNHSCKGEDGSGVPRLNIMLLPEDESLWQAERSRQCLHNKLRHVCFPEKEWLVFPSTAQAKSFAVKYHVFGRDVHAMGPLEVGGSCFCGDLLARAMSTERLALQPGWCSESIFVYAELKLLTCGICQGPTPSVCPRCKSMCYCGSACQKADWKRHKSVCKSLMESAMRPIEPVRDQDDTCQTSAAGPSSSGRDWSTREDDEPYEKYMLQRISAHILRSEWMALQCVLKETREKPLTEHFATSIICSETLLQPMIDEISNARAHGRISPNIESLQKLLANAGTNGYVELSKHYQVVPELLCILRSQDEPVAQVMLGVWSLLNVVMIHGADKHLARAIIDSNFAAFLIQMVSNIESRFEEFEQVNSGPMVWIVPMTMWGHILGNLYRKHILIASSCLLANDVVDQLGRILKLLSASNLVRMTATSMPDLQDTLQILTNCACHAEFAPWLHADVRTRLQHIRLIKEFAASQHGQDGYVNSLSLRRVLVEEPIATPPCQFVVPPANYQCSHCGGYVRSPLFCPRCNRSPYCSKYCLQTHADRHRTLCNLDDLTLEPEDPSSATGAVVSNSVVHQDQSRWSPVILLEFSRNPESFRRCLSEHPCLESCREGLKNSGFSYELPSGAKIFVNPNMFEAILDTVRAEALDLKPRHVIISDDFNDSLQEAIGSLRGGDRVKEKQRSPLIITATECATAAAERSDDVNCGGPPAEAGNLFPYIVKRSFIHIPIASSLCSGPSSSPKTASTTDAHPQSGPNPRHKCRS